MVIFTNEIKILTRFFIVAYVAPTIKEQRSGDFLLYAMVSEPEEIS
jgi:hypothetical protein